MYHGMSIDTTVDDLLGLVVVKSSFMGTNNQNSTRLLEAYRWQLLVMITNMVVGISKWLCQPMVIDGGC